jgi:hypothetical protein
MNIIGFNFTKISGKRMSEIKSKVKIKYNIEIINVEKEKIDLVKQTEVVKFSFKYTIEYEPKFSSIEFEGFILAILTPEQQKQTLKSWKKKKVPDEVRIFLFNLVMSKCNIKALQLEDDLSIPHHIPLPKIRPEQGNTEYVR